MRDQCVGDVSDMLKFSLLRALVGDYTLGVAWYYVPGHNGRPDGKHIAWRDDPAWQRLDPVLHNELNSLPERKVAALERAAIWPHSTLFYNEQVPSTSHRISWGEAMRTELQDANFVFLDPDTGVRFEESSKEHATFDEIRQLRAPGRMLAFIKFPGHYDHDTQVRELHDNLREATGATRSITLRICASVSNSTGGKTPTFRWLTLVDPSEESVVKTYALTSGRNSLDRGTPEHGGEARG